MLAVSVSLTWLPWTSPCPWVVSKVISNPPAGFATVTEPLMRPTLPTTIAYWPISILGSPAVFAILIWSVVDALVIL